MLSRYSRIPYLIALLTAACGYNPTANKANDAGGITGGAGAQAGAMADGGGSTGVVPDPDAAIPLDTSQVIIDAGTPGGATGGKGGAGAGGRAGSVASTGTATGGVSGSTGTTGTIVQQDAGPSPDTVLADAPVTCPSPVAPAHGRVDPKSLNVGGQASYTCDPGYLPPSPAVRNCLADGTWSGAEPTCALVDCGKLDNPPNGRVQVTATTFDSKATYSCDPNYSLSGGDSRSCLSTGLWSGTAPTCQCAQKMCNGACVDIKTDNANCGDCGKICSAPSPSKAACTPTGCLVTLAWAVSPSDLAIDATNVYWTDHNLGGSGTVSKVPLGGGSSTLLSSNQDFPGSIAIDANNVYWANSNEEAIKGVPIAGGPTSTLASPVNGPNGLAVNATHLYYLSNLGVNRVPLAGGDPTNFVPGNGGFAQAIALDSSNVYWRLDLLDGTAAAKIMKQSLQGEIAPVSLATSTSMLYLTVDATHVYWTVPQSMNIGAGSVWKVPVAGGTPTLLASGLDGPQDIAVDGTSVYWTCSRGGQVMRLPVTGGTPTVLASGLRAPTRLAIDATSVYWLDFYGGTTAVSPVMKLTPR